MQAGHSELCTTLCGEAAGGCSQGRAQLAPCARLQHSRDNSGGQDLLHTAALPAWEEWSCAGRKSGMGLQ